MLQNAKNISCYKSTVDTSDIHLSIKMNSNSSWNRTDIFGRIIIVNLIEILIAKVAVEIRVVIVVGMVVFDRN
jgi:hypothetical protein